MRTSAPGATISPLSRLAGLAGRLCLAATVMLWGMPSASAQSTESTDYYLPQTVMQFTVKVEKTTYTPGKFAPYAGRYLKKTVNQDAAITYRLIGMDMTPASQPDTARHFNLFIDKKRSIFKVCRADNGQLLAINTDVRPAPVSLPTFTPAPHTPPLNPNDFMSEDILNAGSAAKMAELTAKEIYDIRDSRNQLSRGQADFMPKDGAQLRIMMANLDRQEQALTQLFEGVTTQDTAWTAINFLPTREGQEVLFRFSKRFGLVDADDLSGEPYYIEVTDLHSVAAPEPSPIEKKEDKNDIGLRVVQPGKIRANITDGVKTINSYELLAPQFGTVSSMSGELFGKKQSAKIIFDPLTGSVKTIETIPVE